MAVTIAVTRIDMTQEAQIVEGLLTLSGSYVTGGDTVNFSTLANILSGAGPMGLVEFDEQPASGATPGGYMFYLIAGSTMANWLLFIVTAVGQPPTQLGAGAYAAGLLATTLQFRAYFPYNAANLISPLL